MYNDFNEKITKEVILLMDLINVGRDSFYEYFDSWSLQWKKEEEYPNKSKEEIKEEVKKEKMNTTNKLKEESIKYYQIDNEKKKELEKVFKEIKLKIIFNSQPRILRDGKFYTISNGVFTIYDEKFFKKIIEIKFEANVKIFSAIQLDNKDLVFFAKDQLIIYRLQNGKYFLFQKIDENAAGYKSQMAYSGCMGYPKTYSALFINEISGNRFICVSNYGFKIYSLNDKNEYSIALLETYEESIRTIYELEKDNFIFCTQIDCGASLGEPAHNILMIDKINLKEITNEEKDKRLKELEGKNYNYDYDYSGRRNEKKGKQITNEDVKRTIKSLKYTYNHKEFFEYSTYGGHHYFKGNIILKNKYFITGIDNNILIFDISTGKQLKRYEVSAEGEDNLYKCGCNIKKWNNNNDNEFILNIKGNIILFELTNDIELKIINKAYFKDITSLKQLNEKDNHFYDDNTKEDSDDNPYFRSFYYDYERNDNKNVNVSIFY